MGTAKARDEAGMAELVAILERRFKAHPERHAGIAWAEVSARLEAAPERLRALGRMEATGGEPDVVGRDEADGSLVFADCSAETPKDRRSLCYDDEALAARKENKPAGSALGMALAMGAELLDEAGYRALQELGEFDLKTSSWVRTPDAQRRLGGALFCDRRYGRVFTYHNGAESYYGVRGFRCSVRV